MLNWGNKTRKVVRTAKNFLKTQRLRKDIMLNHMIQEFNVFESELVSSESPFLQKLLAFNWDTLNEFIHHFIGRAILCSIE